MDVSSSLHGRVILVLNVAIPCIIIIVSTTVQGGKLSSSADTDCFPPPQKKYKGLPKDTHVRCIIIIALSLPSDVVFIVDGERVPAHKLILASQSEYFRAMLYGEMKEASHLRLTCRALMPS